MLAETIILAPGANGPEIIRSLAKHGVNTIGTRIVPAEELARIALMHSGAAIEEDYISRSEEESIVYSILQDCNIEYFRNSRSFADAGKIAEGIRIIRSMIAVPAEEEAARIREALLDSPEFPEKNSALADIYERYTAYCKAEGLIDQLGVVRKALSAAGPLPGARLMVLREYPLTVLEEALISALSDGKYEVSSLFELFKAEKKAPRITSFTSGYGVINEVENIVDEIYKSKDIRADECVIACADVRTYSQVFYDVCKRYSIPVTFGTGVPITNSRPAELLRLLVEWDGTGHHGVDALKRILSSSSFNKNALAEALGLDDVKKLFENGAYGKLIKMAGQLQISFDSALNAKRTAALRPVLKDAEDLLLIGWTEKLAEEFGKGAAYFISKYANCRKTGDYERSLDIAARELIAGQLRSVKRSLKDGASFRIGEFAQDILEKNICRQSSKEGAVHLTGIKGALAVCRKKLYVCGLSADNFPGDVRENYLLLDSDAKLFEKYDPGKDQVKRFGSLEQVEQNRKDLDSLLALAASLGADTEISFCGYSVSDLKQANPSSVLFRYYKEAEPAADYKSFIGSIKEVGFFGPELSDSRAVARLDLEEKSVAAAPEGLDVFAGYKKEDWLGKAWSPTALDKFFACPKHFYLNAIMGFPDEEEDDVYALMDSTSTGNMAHHLFEELAKDPSITRDDFIKMSEKAINEYFLRRIPLDASLAKGETQRFVRMMTTAYDRQVQLNRTLLAAEEEITQVHPAGIKLHGYPDRVEKTAAGEYIITDYKTKRRKEHIQDDINTCLQVVIYAWLYEQESGNKVERCEYRYLRQDEIITCRFDDDMKKALEEKLLQFKDALENCSFPGLPDKGSNKCIYCRMGDICTSTKWPDANTADAADPAKGE